MQIKKNKCIDLRIDNRHKKITWNLIKLSFRKDVYIIMSLFIQYSSTTNLKIIN